jgi:hypothetical protein
MVKAKKVSAGDSHLVGVSLDNTLVGWGSNDYKQLSFPPNIVKIKDVVAGRESTIAIRDDGSVVGFGTDETVTNLPAGLKAKKIATNQYQCIAIKEDGSIVVWGVDNPHIQVQLKDSIPADLKAKDLSLTDGHVLFILEDDTVAAFGNNEFNQTVVPSGLKAKKVVAETTMSFAIDMDNNIKFWGHTGYGDNFTPPGIAAHDIGVGGSMLIVIEEQTRDAVIIDYDSQELSKMKLHSQTAPETVTIGTQESVWFTLANGEIEGFYSFFDTDDPDVFLHDDEFPDRGMYDDYSLAGTDDDEFSLAGDDDEERVDPHRLPKLKIPEDLPTDQIKDATVPTEVFDPLMASDVSTAEYIAEDKGNAVFIVGTGASGYPKDQLTNDYNDGSAIVYQCPKQMGLMVTPNDAIMDTPYYRLKTGQGNLLVPLDQFMSVLESNHQMFQLSELKTLEFTAGRAAISTDGNYTLDRQPLNLVSMDHCTAGTTKKVYSLTPVKATATGGKVKRKTKKVRSYKRTSN